jgi:16S rRNA (cytosine967-C5)-methyltransferase
MSALTPARRLALRVLTRVGRGGETLADALAARDVVDLEPRERSFLHELTLGTLRLRGLLDHALAPHVDRPLHLLDPVALDILRLGAHQMLHLRVPDRAAVSQAVELAKERVPRASGFVNAVLRGLARAGPASVPDPGTDPRSWLTTAGSLPPWLADRWIERLGPAGALARARRFLEPGPTSVRLNPRVEDAPARCREAGVELLPLAVPGAFLVEGGRTTDLTAQGVLYPQDQGSQLVGRLAAGAGLALDACAAPGGKALLMADLAGGDGRVVAAEPSPRRLRTMAELARRWGSPNVTLVRADAGRPPFASRFDTVLLDAPCSGLGTLGRHPDIRWRIRPGEIERQAGRQGRLLASVSRLVRPGGRLVYATCSLEEEETTAVVLAFLAKTPAFRRATLPDWTGDFVDPDGFVRTRPEREAADGFFAAALERAPDGL